MPCNSCGYKFRLHEGVFSPALMKFRCPSCEIRFSFGASFWTLALLFGTSAYVVGEVASDKYLSSMWGLFETAGFLGAFLVGIGVLNFLYPLSYGGHAKFRIPNS